MNRAIRNSAKALIIKDGKVLAIRIRDQDKEWYIMPGGGQESEELLTDAVCREVVEETGIEVTAKELVFVIEDVHGEPFHRVDFVFLCEYIGELPNAASHKEHNQTGCEWLDIKTLTRSKLYPSKLRRQITNLYEGKPYKVYLGNEEVGDSECSE